MIEPYVPISVAEMVVELSVSIQKVHPALSILSKAGLSLYNLETSCKIPQLPLRDLIWILFAGLGNVDIFLQVGLQNRMDYGVCLHFGPKWPNESFKVL